MKTFVNTKEIWVSISTSRLAPDGAGRAESSRPSQTADAVAGPSNFQVHELYVDLFE